MDSVDPERYIPCGPDASCKYALRDSGCRETVHHEYWPANDYHSGVEKKFRNLPENKTVVCRAVHDAIHRIETPPPKPDREFMLRIINEATR